MSFKVEFSAPAPRRDQNQGGRTCRSDEHPVYLLSTRL